MYKCTKEYVRGRIEEKLAGYEYQSWAFGGEKERSILLAWMDLIWI
jgi:hypothetical protein